MAGQSYPSLRKLCQGIQPKHADKLEDILAVLEAAATVQDLNFPGSGLHQLQPKKDNRWAIKVSGNWRITFRFEERDVYEVDYEDYH
jgi:proteic killer suppression protein